MTMARRIPSLARGAPVAATLVALVLGLCAPGAHAQCLDPPGDLNADAQTDIVDIQCALIAALADQAGDPLPACLHAPLAATDVDCDGQFVVADVLTIVYYAAGLPLDPALDANANDCPDACEVPGSAEVLPVYAAGTSSSASWTVTSVAPGFQASGVSAGGGFVLTPASMGSTASQ